MSLPAPNLLQILGTKYGGIAEVPPLLEVLIRSHNELGIDPQDLQRRLVGLEAGFMRSHHPDAVASRLLPASLNPVQTMTKLYLQALPYPTPPSLDLEISPAAERGLRETQTKGRLRQLLPHAPEVSTERIAAMFGLCMDKFPHMKDVFLLDLRRARFFFECAKRQNRWNPRHDGLIYNVFMAMACEERLLGSTIPTKDPISGLAHDQVLPEPLVDCAGYLLGQMIPDDEYGHCLDLSQDIPIGMLRKILLTLYHPLKRDEPIEVNDLVIYYPDEPTSQLEGMAHVGRVVLVRGETLWVESKWGHYARPCLHPIDFVVPSYGHLYCVLRLKDGGKPQSSEKSFAKQGFCLPRQRGFDDAEIGAIGGRLARYYDMPDQLARLGYDLEDAVTLLSMHWKG